MQNRKDFRISQQRRKKKDSKAKLNSWRPILLLWQER